MNNRHLKIEKVIPNKPCLNIKIYILCHNNFIFENIIKIYEKYKWACPILMKYQDATFENAFWKQLLEIQEDWENCDMVGTLSSISYLKLDLEKVNKIILETNEECNFFHFLESNSNVSILNIKLQHPNFNIIWKNIIENLKLNDCKESYCNYWMCKPKYMKQFIDWYLNIELPIVINHPLIMTNSKYNGYLNNNQLQKLCGVPYYPILPFVLERLNPCYFYNLLDNLKIKNNLD